MLLEILLIALVVSFLTAGITVECGLARRMGWVR